MPVARDVSGPDATAQLAVLQDVLQTVRRVALISTDPRGIITSFNHGAELLTGYRADEVIDRATPLLFHLPAEVAARAGREDGPACGCAETYELFTRDATLDAVDELECTYRRKDGSHVAVYLGIQALCGDPAKGFLSTLRPVPGQSISGSENGIRAFAGRPAIDQSKEGVLELARDWTVLYTNQRALQILPDLLLTRNIWDLYPTLVGTYVEQHLRSAMEDRQPTHYENHYPPLDMWFRVYAVPSPSGIKTVFEDITAEKKLAAELARERILREKRVEALSHMAGGLAHEISNPIAIINMLADDLNTFATGRTAVDSVEVIATCENILATSNRAMAILRGLKGFTREASKDPMISTAVAKIVDDCVQLQQSRFERECIELRIELEAGLPPVVCREVQIGQIVNNLLNNAYDSIVATIVSSRAANGWVCVHAFAVAKSIHLEVTDSGPGVPEEAKPHLMEPFFTTKEIGGGTGIGLSLSRAIAEDHGGTLVLVEHAGPTCFRLVLPLSGLKAECIKPIESKELML